MVASSAEVKSEAKDGEKWLGAVGYLLCPALCKEGINMTISSRLFWFIVFIGGRDCSDWGLGFIRPSKATAPT